MDLLTNEHRASLLAVLYGLLMIMPQTDAFHMLYRRLQCVPVNLTLPPAASGHKDEKKEKKSNPLNSYGWAELLDNFKRVQQAHVDYRRVKHKELIAKTT